MISTYSVSTLLLGVDFSSQDRDVQSMSRQILEHGQGEDITTRKGLADYLDGLVENLYSSLDSFEQSPVNGRIYPASSINYTRDSGHEQTASSPAYWGGIWSLSCCKHDMRQEHFFDYFEEHDSGVLWPTEPLFIFTTAGKGGSERPKWAESKRRWLVSVALVTHAFRDMDDYGRFLLDQNEMAWKPRISTDPDDDSAWARKYGDCHALVNNGEVVGTDAPYPEHDHVSSSGTSSCGCSETINREYDHVYYEDLDPNRLKFVSTSEYWVSWNKPAFYWTVGNGPDRYGGGQGTRAYDGNRSIGTDTIVDSLHEAF